MIPDGQFPQFSPSGLYLGCGSTRLTVARVDVVGGVIVLSDVTDVGEGHYANWYNPGGAPAEQLLYSNRATTLMVVPMPPPFVAQVLTAMPGANSLGAGGGVWATFLAAGSVVMRFSDGSTTAGRLDIPAGPSVDQGGRAVFLSDSTAQLFLRSAAGAINLLDSAAAIFRPHISTQGVLWHRRIGGQFITHGSRGSGIELVHVTAGSAFWAVPVDTPAGPWILEHYSGSLYLRAWGQSTVRQVATGFTNYPHAVYSTTHGGFLIAWGDEGGALQTAFLSLDVMAVEQPTTPAPIPGGGGSGAGPGGSVPVDAGSLTVTPPAKFVPQRHRIYPHVAEVSDKPAQQTIKLLWDRVQELTERIEIGDVAQRFATVEGRISGTNTRIDQQAEQIVSDPGETQLTGIPTGGVPGEPGPAPPPGGGSGGSGSCADSPGTGHYDPGGPLTNERARKITCGTGDEWSNLRVPTTTLAERESNAETLLRRIIWHLNLGGFTAGRQRNPSLAISKDKLTVVIGTETRAFDVFFDWDTFSNTIRMQWSETFPADQVADAGIAD